MLGVDKMELLIPLGKENKKSFRDPVALEQASKDKEHLSTAKKAKETPSIEKYTYRHQQTILNILQTT